MTLTVGVDVGGTKIAAGLVDEDGTVVFRVHRQTPASDLDALLTGVISVIDECRRHQEPAAVGIAAAGFIGADRATVAFAPNLPWRDEPLAVRVTEHTALPTLVENDANAAAWAEHRFGAGAGEDLACVTVGTGIGGGLVVNGQLVRGRWGFAGEFGHMLLVPDGHWCGCGQRGCWEQYASGRALLREARERADYDPGRAAVLLGLGDGTPRGVLGVHVTLAAAAGDLVAKEAFAEAAEAMAHGLWRLAAILGSPVVVLAGGVVDAGALYIDPVRGALVQFADRLPYRPLPDVRIAQLGGDAGLIGAADLARR